MLQVTQRPNDLTLRPIRSRWGIATRIALAFALVVGLSSLTCLAGLLLYERLSIEMQRIAQHELPRLSAATRLARTGADINASVALLSRAETLAEFETLFEEARERFARLESAISSSSEWRDNASLHDRQHELTENLEALEVLALLRFNLAARQRELVEELRWLQADLIVEIEPLIDDARFNIAQDLQIAAAPDSVLRESARSEALLTTLAQANLSVGLLSRFSELSSRSGVSDALAFLDDSTDDLSRSIEVLTAWSDSITVRQLASRVLSLSDRENGLPALKFGELDILTDITTSIVSAQGAVEALNAQIGLEVSESEAVSRAASSSVETVLMIGRVLLITIVALSIGGAWAVAYFYVYRNIVAGIRRLAEEAVNASQGLPASTEPLPRNGELGELSTALEQLRQTRDDLIQSAKLAALGQMATGIAHELNQPLSALRSHSFNGSRQLDRGNVASAKVSLEKITGLIERMSNQISHIRRFARRPEDTLERTSVRASMTEAIALLSHRLETEGVVISVEPANADTFDARAEPVRLEQVLINLLANSMDCMAGRTERRIDVELQRGPGSIQVRLRDTGPGISADEQDKIFDPFFTTKAPGAGLGLGLSISFNIARDFGGRLVLESSSPSGSVFILELKDWARD
ncbi:MAG: two-component sensor histidine kinase [Devosia sp.]|uniref:ATP-binding protein n=1 Tax=Devosia sp. TaxID=1871048 RepID=UPI0024C5C435|nr:ATP-binding protein [Devosia sp.]UYO00532.1 MAG: two-component sensor histidine kinase [Devosia sp.]